MSWERTQVHLLISSGTLDERLALQPDLSKGFECYVDTDWTDNYNKTYVEEPFTACSLTGYVIYYARCPMICGSKMQSIVTLSTTEPEYIVLSTATREVIALMSLLTELRDYGISIPFVKTVCCKVWKSMLHALKSQSSQSCDIKPNTLQWDCIISPYHSPHFNPRTDHQHLHQAIIIKSVCLLALQINGLVSNVARGSVILCTLMWDHCSGAAHIFLRCHVPPDHTPYYWISF